MWGCIMTFATPRCPHRNFPNDFGAGLRTGYEGASYFLTRLVGRNKEKIVGGKYF